MIQNQCGECLSAIRKQFWMFESNLIFVHQHSDTSFWKQWIFRHVSTVTVVPQLLWVSCKNKYTALTVKSDSWTNDSYKPGWFLLIFENAQKDLRIIKWTNSMNQHLTNCMSLTILHTRFVKLKPVSHSLLDWFSYGNAKLKITAILFAKEKNIKTWIRFHRLFVLSNCYMCNL